MDAEPSALAFDVHPGPVRLVQTANGLRGSLERAGEGLRRGDQSRLAVAFLQSMVANKEDAVDWQTGRERVGITAADHRDA